MSALVLPDGDDGDGEAVGEGEGEVGGVVSNCVRNFHASPEVQVLQPSQVHPSIGPGVWPPSNAAHTTGYPARHPE
ncbi:hypothetical protein [Microbispora sp. GKU 823]|uniref:hypothetical protein n=1 Tax=Microbispora sp. GKU 823 TaxID=1652100 RepID=UPI001C4E0908|nr:hypothetical protein [Microbispora sp. GKU 823]